MSQCFAQNRIQASLIFTMLYVTVNLKQNLNFANLDDSLRDKDLEFRFFGEVEVAIHTLTIS